MCACLAALIVALPAHANAASPELEFVAPPSAFPIHFTATGGPVNAAMAEFEPEVHCTGSQGEGEITGPRSTRSHYVFTGCEARGGTENGHECKSEDANAEEIKTKSIDADLVYISQVRHEVGMLLNLQGDVYMNFECGGEPVKGTGSFLSPVGPINQQATSFTAFLTRSGALQIPNEYENANGEKLQAIPMGEREGHPAATTGVELGFTIHTDIPLEVKAVTAAEVEAAEAKTRDEEAAAKKRQEEEAAKKKHEEEEAAAKKRLEEEQAKFKKPTRAQLLSNALKRCRKFTSKHKRTRCEVRAKRKYGHHKHGQVRRPPYAASRRG